MMHDDFSTPRRMSRGALLIIYAKLFRRLLAPLAFIVAYNLLTFKGQVRLGLALSMTAVITILPLIWALINYFTQKFYVKDGSLIFIHGLFNRENTIVPLDSIHSLRTERGLFFRLLDMRGIIFDTLATRQEEIELILDEYDWEQLIDAIQTEEKHSGHSSDEPPAYDPSHTVCYPNKSLILAALCQNHLNGLAVFGSLIALFLEYIGGLSSEELYVFASKMGRWSEWSFLSPLKLAGLLVMVYLVVLAVWLTRTLLRYYDTTLKYDSKILTFTFGLLNRVSSRFYSDRICTLSIKRNFLERHFGYSTTMFHQALNATAENESDNLKLYGVDSSPFFLSWWLGRDYSQESLVGVSRSGIGVFYLTVGLRAAVAIALGIVLVCADLYTLALLPAAYILLLVMKGVLAMRHSSIELRQTYCIVRRGELAEEDNYVRYSNVEVVSLIRSPLTRWTGRVTLALSTSGTTYYVRSLREHEALRLREVILTKAFDIAGGG